MRYRLILPEWGVKAKVGPTTIEGDDFSHEFLEEKNILGYGIYYFPNHNSGKLPPSHALEGKDVDVFNCVFVDMDLKDKVYKSKAEFIEVLTKFSCLPNKVVISGGGVHAYWNVKDLNRERLCSLSLRLIRHFKTDRSIWTVLQLMRKEGYYHTKDQNDYKMVEADSLADQPYSYAELATALPVLLDEDERRITKHLRKIDGLDVVEELKDINTEELPTKFLELFDKNKKVQELFQDQDGDRSSNDYEMTCLLFENNISKKNAIAVIANCPKARSMDDPQSYIYATVDKVYKGKAKYTVQSVADKTREGTADKRRGRLVNGPDYFDATEKRWRTQQCLGVVGGPGIGKSTQTLDIFRAIIENNPESDDICVYFNLEMTDWEIIEKWHALTDNDPEMAKRLFVVSNEDDEGNPRNINLQQIHWFCRDIQMSTGKRIVAIAIDHIGVINPTIDVRKKPDFGMVGEMDGAFGDFRSVSIRKMPQLIKELCKQLDCFLIVQSQTTKAKGMDGDTPLGIEAAYGAAQFEQYMDYVMTLWQPLRRVHSKTPLRIMGWKYCKIRHKHKKDKVEAYQDYMLAVDIDSGRLAPLTHEEMDEFEILNKEATVLRKKTEKKEEITYKNSGGIAKLRSILAAKAN